MNLKIKSMGALALLLSLIFFTSASIPVNAAVGLAVSPSVVSINDMLRGSTANTTITVYNPSDSPLDYVANVSASISDTISVAPNAGSVAGKSSVPLTVTVHVSETKPNGDYTGSIVINASASARGQVTIAPAIEVKASYSVTDIETQGLTVTDVQLYDTELGSPFPFLVNGTGTGNVDSVGYLRIDLRDIKTNASVGTYNSSQFTITSRKTESASGTYGNGSNVPVGQYSARADVIFNGTSIYNVTKQVEVFERGVLKSKGELERISLNPWSTVGETVKLTGVFTNTGEVGVNGTLRLEISKDGKLVATANSDPLLVLPGQTANLVAYFSPTSAGKYQIDGHVAYANKQTEDKATILNVQDSGANLLLIGGVTVTLLAVFVIGVYYDKKRA
jgi:hypothetical protein